MATAEAADLAGSENPVNMVVICLLLERALWFCAVYIVLGSWQLFVSLLMAVESVFTYGRGGRTTHRQHIPNKLTWYVGSN